MIKRAGTFNSVLLENSIECTPKKSINDIFADIKKQKSVVEQNLENNNWAILPTWLKEYVDQRKIYKSPYIKKTWELLYDKTTNRLVIPWTDEYYQERAITKQQEEEEGKYLFPPETEKPVFGLDLIDPNFKYLFLLEGVFDAIFVKNGLAVGSLKLSNHQKEILAQYKDYTIVYFMDNQYKDQSSHDETLKLTKENPWINIFIWPEKLKKYKDVNESIIASDEFLRLWSNEKFLTSRVFNRN